MARTKFASLHSGLLVRKGEAAPAPPPAIAPKDGTAEEVERSFKDGDVAENSELSPTLDRMVNADFSAENDVETPSQTSDSASVDERPGVEPEVDDSLLIEMEPQAEIRSVADILALGRTRGALPIPQAANGHANGGAIVTLHLTAAQIERLDTVADRDGLPAAQLVMNAVTEYIRKVVAEN